MSRNPFSCPMETNPASGLDFLRGIVKFRLSYLDFLRNLLVSFGLRYSGPPHLPLSCCVCFLRCVLRRSATLRSICAASTLMRSDSGFNFCGWVGRPIPKKASNRIQKIEGDYKRHTETVCLRKHQNIKHVGTSTKTDVTKNAPNTALARDKLAMRKLNPTWSNPTSLLKRRSKRGRSSTQ